MAPQEALHAVMADIRDHRITPDGSGLFTAARHIGLLCHLAASLAADASYHAGDRRPAPARTTATPFGETAGHLGRAIAHYTQALAPLTFIAQPDASSPLRKQLDTIDHYSRVRVHLSNADRP